MPRQRSPSRWSEQNTEYTAGYVVPHRQHGSQRLQKKLTAGAPGPRSATHRRAMGSEDVDFREVPWDPERGRNRTSHSMTGLHRHNPGTPQEHLEREYNYFSNIFRFPNSTWMHQIYFFIFLKSQVQALLFPCIKSFTTSVVEEKEEIKL